MISSSSNNRILLETLRPKLMKECSAKIYLTNLHSPFLKSEWAFEKRIRPSKMVNEFTLEGESPFLRMNSREG
jgi:hypothetical protein